MPLRMISDSLDETDITCVMLPSFCFQYFVASLLVYIKVGHGMPCPYDRYVIYRADKVNNT